jgi:NADPH:quinone reductase-like Zn-dependent oxidoreductase
MGGSYLNQNIAALGMDGRVVMLGFLGGAHARDVDLLAIMGKRAVITGSLLRARTREEKASIAEQLHEYVWPVLAAGRCRPMIDRSMRSTMRPKPIRAWKVAITLARSCCVWIDTRANPVGACLLPKAARQLT